MGAIVNGLSLSRLKPYGAAFFIFSDYARPAIRLSALMELPIIFILTHDAMGDGESWVSLSVCLAELVFECSMAMAINNIRIPSATRNESMVMLKNCNMDSPRNNVNSRIVATSKTTEWACREIRNNRR